MSKTKKFVVEKGYYEILEVMPACTTIELDRAFSRLFSEYVNINDENNETRRKSAEVLFNLTKAYEILSDPFQRLSYDERRFKNKLPFNNEVETIFKEGIKNYRQNKLDNAIHFLKEAVYLHPHKINYRVNLAIAYFDKGLNQDTANQLKIALKLEPDNQFAKEVIARLLFGVTDKKTLGFFTSKINKQIFGIFAISISLIGIGFFVFPKISKYIENNKNSKDNQLVSKKMSEINAQLPSDFKQAVVQNKNEVKIIDKKSNLNKLPDEIKLEGQVHDYSKLKVVKETFYSSQNIVVINYEDGSLTSYKVDDVLGWKYDLNTKTPVIITKANEIIPVPSGMGVTLDDGSTVLEGDEKYPSWAFPNTMPTNIGTNSDNQVQNPTHIEEENKNQNNNGLPDIGQAP